MLSLRLVNHQLRHIPHPRCRYLPQKPQQRNEDVQKPRKPEEKESNNESTVVFASTLHKDRVVTWLLHVAAIDVPVLEYVKTKSLFVPATLEAQQENTRCLGYRARPSGRGYWAKIFWSLVEPAVEGTEDTVQPTNSMNEH